MLIYILILLIIILIGFLLLNLRIKVRLSKEERFLFAGLGRSGSEFDFSSKKGTLKLFGLSLKQFSLTKTEKKSKEKKAKKRKRKSKRTRPIKDALMLLSQSFIAFKNFIISIFRSIIVEELDGEITAGFKSPHITGHVYGYYQAVAGIVPNFNERFTFSPVWDESTFDGRFRASVSLPLYILIYRFMIFITSLPLRKIFTFIIGKKRGDQNGR
jgi:hypothetical protein